MKRIPRIEQEAGNRIHLNVIREDASYIRDSVNDTLSNLIMGIVLTSIILMIFLHDWRSTIIISIAMPFSIIATFLVMQYMKISINVLSLMGLSCAVGTLVANSVVVLENIFSHREKGLSTVDAASIGTKEVLMAVIASSGTNVAVFVPLGSMQGAMGNILGDFAWAIVISTIFSIVVSLTVTPLLASRLLRAKDLTAKENQKRISKLGQKIDAFFNKIEYIYGKSVAFFIARKKRSAAFIVVTLIIFVISLIGFSKIEMELIPKTDGGKVQVTVELPQGSSLEMTATVLTEIEKRLAMYPDLQTILTVLGNAGSLNRDVSIAQVNVSLVPKKTRSMNNDEVASAMTRTLSTIPGANIKVVAQSELWIAEGAPINLSIKGPDNAILQDIGTRFRDEVAKTPGIMNAAISTKSGKRELVFEPNRKQILSDGLTVQTVATALRFAIDGLVTTSYREGGAEYDIRVKMSSDSLREIEDIRNIPVVTPSGIYPLSRYASVHYEDGYNMIMRLNKLRYVEFTADLLPGYTQGTVLAQIMQIAEKIEMPPGYSITQAGLSDSMSEAMVSMAIVFLTAILLVYILLAVILESAVQPLFLITAIPLSFIGITSFCLLTGTVLNNVAMIGIVMLVGIVVNNGILILDQYNRLKQNGFNVRDALIQACQDKLKAILMSNIAVIMGIIPMAMGIGESLAEMRQPMGIVVIGGIISSMVMTLWLIPCLEFVTRRRSTIDSHVDVIPVEAVPNDPQSAIADSKSFLTRADGEAVEGVSE
jgi:HAE1 family hydrophobic/amphiphilic exporter-1